MKNINTSIFILVFSLFFSTASLAQNTAIDSLTNKLSLHTQKDSTRVKILNNLLFLITVKMSLKL